MDFAENYSCTSQDEVQSVHWSNTQATIHPIMAFINSSDVEGQITHKESHIFISDDNRHDADAVTKFVSTSYEELKTKHNILHVEEFSDCCAAQYRCSKSICDLSHRASDMGLSSVNHHYFESCHGKNSSDGLGAIVKYNEKTRLSLGDK